MESHQHQLSEDQINRFSKAFNQLLNPDVLKQFVSTWSRDPEAALNLFSLTQEDIADLHTYLYLYDTPTPFVRAW